LNTYALSQVLTLNQHFAIIGTLAWRAFQLSGQNTHGPWVHRNSGRKGSSMNWITTRRIIRTHSFPPGIALLLPLLAFPAMATLGGESASIQQDASHFKAQIRMTQKQAYVVHEMQTAGGATVREYVSSSGKVFGVAWEGPDS
jgi:hypothetical protein